MTLPEIALTEPVGPAGAPLLVLGHSLGTGSLIWEPVVPALAAAYRVTLLSLPGHDTAPVPAHPFSMAELGDAVAARVRELTGGVGGALYAGVSIGGALALTLALQHPETFAAVASLASAASLGDREHWTKRAALVREQSTSVLVAPSAQSWFAPESIAREPELTGRILRVLQNTSDEGYARCAEALAGYDLRGRLGEIRIPVLALGGEADTVAPAERQDEIVAGVPDARSVIIAGAAHQPPAEQGAAVAAALLEFFGGVTR
ncbi:alpha/beta fold hydrolase [Leucobacter luti]|uniref:3-oxoadipate enol-lactonase n=1 Tax=Leucobacter luti TaxID=340320 RepID=A0A4Q7TZY4_9MICO|nr:alpha/beta fold hydrolase [Leucobacter luti]MBL3699198.1 alpha/beta fold hydrolase [Leucobacter luti]RZT66696.1 3-oxoadipate enol-lactonase [Leucobacter luti]